MCDYTKRYIFQESVDHCRWKNVLRNHILTRDELQENVLHQYSCKSFDEILWIVFNLCDKIEGIGMLTIYDITSAICRYNKINIDKVYIIGKGPKRAIRLLDIPTKKCKIQNITLKYVEITDIINAFNENKNEIIHLQSNNGDDFESYLCNWQKNK
jgi:hypothetical protein